MASTVLPYTPAETLAPVRLTADDLSRHVCDILRHFPEHMRADVAGELIDKAQRRGAVDAATATAVATELLSCLA